MARTNVNPNADLRGQLLPLYFPSGQFPTGDVYWVSSVTGSDAVKPNQGTSPGAPFASTNYAISQATANNGDVILWMPGHSETLTGAAGINVNKAGLTFLGVPGGFGRNRATFNYTTSAAASFDINSANTVIRNAVFTPIGVATVTAAINVKAADCWIEDCEFELANSTNQAALGILTTAAANRMLLRRLHIHGTNNGTTGPIRVVGGTDSRIEDCDIIAAGVTTVGCIEIATTAAVNLMIQRSRLINLTAASTTAIKDTITGTTGIVSDCRLGVRTGTAPIVAATMSWLFNRYVAALGASDAAP